LSFYDPQGEYGYQKPYSEKTAELIDEEVRRIVSEAYERTRNMILEKKEQVQAIAEELLHKEILFQSDLERLIGKRPFESKAVEEIREVIAVQEPVNYPESEEQLKADTDQAENSEKTDIEDNA
jgi:cell division protease FtsH